MENQTKINIAYAITILALIAGFTTIIVTDDKGVVLEPTHYCNSTHLKMYCTRTTAYYCYPSNETRIGSKKCSEGWKEIPVIPAMEKRDYRTGEEILCHPPPRYNCTKK